MEQDSIPLLPVGLDDGSGDGQACSHEFGWVPVSDPTCTDPGVERGTCIHCGGWQDRNVAALGHAWEETVVREADCLNALKVQQVCSVCGEKGLESYGATGWHDWQAVALLDMDGSTVYALSCSICGTLRTDVSGVAE